MLPCPNSSAEHLVAARSAAMPPCWYEGTNILNVPFDSLSKQYHALIKRIAEYEDDKSLTCRMHRGFNVSTLALHTFETVKTHKEPGQVKLRIVHCGAACVWNQLGQWVMHMIRPNLKK